MLAMKYKSRVVKVKTGKTPLPKSLEKSQENEDYREINDSSRRVSRSGGGWGPYVLR